VTAYFGRNLSKDELELCKAFMFQEKIDPLNTRTFKIAPYHYMITVGSITTEGSFVNDDFKGSKFEVKFGEFAPYLEIMNGYLAKCKNYAANENQEKMIDKYIEHYQTGSIDVHKDSQRAWIADKKPVVESNMGWIETYIDPSGERAYWEGWVAIVDKEKSAKFEQLVKNSETIIPKLPWPAHMEKDNFLAPDFTTLEIINFASNSCPLGINIPNYDDIRETEGFKNVYLNNSMGTPSKSNVQFATEEQSNILSEYTLRSYEVHVACHELLGHGVGKLIYRNADGTCPSFTDPVNGETFESCYEEGETWNSKFGSIATSYEECRADTCGFYLEWLPEVYSLFGW
jgi:dipeptidyl-peptidase III